MYSVKLYFLQDYRSLVNGLLNNINGCLNYVELQTVCHLSAPFVADMAANYKTRKSAENKSRTGLNFSVEYWKFTKMFNFISLLTIHVKYVQTVAMKR